MNSETHSQFSTVNSPLIPPGYKQTEVGVIPEEWEVSRLQQTLEIKTDQIPAWFVKAVLSKIVPAEPKP